MANSTSTPLTILSLGVDSFADAAAAAGGEVVRIDWRPPAGGDSNAAWTLAELLDNQEVDTANSEALEKFLGASPRLVAVQSASEAIPALAEKPTILHAGPPIPWEDMCGPMRGAILGAAVFEGWAGTIDAANEMVDSGHITLEPCHHHNAVGPMAGIVSPSMPVWVVENTATGDRAYSNFNEGLGEVLRFGAHSTEVIERLQWMRDTLAPVLAAAVAEVGGIAVKPIISQALLMGDEVHNRNAAATSLLLKELLGGILRVEKNENTLTAVCEFITGNDHFFLNLSMASAKVMLMAAEGTEHSSMVTVMARNGVNFGIQIAGLPGRWFQAPANPVDGLFFPGYSVTDAAADLGDSAITETAGLGGFAMAAAPAIVKFVGGTPADATTHSLRMREITCGTNPAFSLPPLNFSGSGAGIDIRKVVDSGILPVINSGIAHREAGVGQIGAGITTAPLTCFIAAIAALSARLTGGDKGDGC